MYQHRNNAVAKVAARRKPGENRLVLDDASSFGDPTPESPIRASIFRNRRPLGIYRVEGRDDNALLAVAPIEGFGEVDWLPGDDVANVLTAGDLDEPAEAFAELAQTVDDLAQALDEIELEPGRDGKDGRDGRDGADGKDGDPGPPGVGSFGLAMPAGFSVANSPLTDSGTILVTTSLDGLVKASGGGFVGAVDDVDYATPGLVADEIQGVVEFLVETFEGEFEKYVSLEGDQAVMGQKTLVEPIFAGGFSVRNSVGSEVAGFDGEGRGFVEKFVFRFLDGFLRPGPNQSGQGALAAFDGKLRSLVVKIRSNPASGGFGLQIRRNGAPIFPAPVVVAAGDLAVKVFEDFADDAVELGDEFTIDVTHAGEGVAGVVAVLAALVRNR